MNIENSDAFIEKTHDLLKNVIVDILQDSKAGKDAHKVEKYIQQTLCKMGFNLVELFFSSFGNGDQGSKIFTSKNHTVRRLNELHVKPYMSIFGEHKILRTVYGSRKGQKIEMVPLDAALNLPKSKFSYLLQDWDQSLIVESPYAKVSDTIEKIMGINQSIHSMERINKDMSSSVDSFWKDSKLTPPKEEESKIFVCSVDGKGVPIRNSENPLNCNLIEPIQNPLEKLKKTEKTGGKKMSLVGATYTINPYIRTPEEIQEALFREKKEKEGSSIRPIPIHKHVRASLLRDDFDTSEPSYKEIFNWISDEENNRNSDGNKKIVCVMDGQDSLWKAMEKYLPEKNIVEVLDLLHACGYAWEATHMFYKKKSVTAAIFAKKIILRILKGEVTEVVQTLKRKGKYDELSDDKIESLNKICRYFVNNSHRMKYNEYLEAGYPIASGVIEGACRYVVKDRMERTGMRWILQGAHSMLGIRSIYLSGFWEIFMEYRTKKECESLYPYRRNICSNVDDEILLKTA